MKVLDVGSGGNPLFSAKDEVVHVDIGRDPHLEVRCDAHYLPFRDKCFRVVHASHVLEHVNYPLTVLKELKSVCCGVVIVKVPNAKNDVSLQSDHIYSWNRLTFECFLRKVFREVQIMETVRVTPYRNKLTRLITKVKFAVLVAFTGRNELTAICIV